MKSLFTLLQVVTGMMAVAALLILLAIVLLRSMAVFAKESAGSLRYVAQLFTSGFTRGTSPGKPTGWVISWPQAGLALLFVAMLVSVFLPGLKILLHSVAVLAGVAILWYGRMLMTGKKLEILCLPLIIVWFIYYLMCLWEVGS